MTEPNEFAEKRRHPRVAVQLTAKYRPAGAAKKAKMREDPMTTLGEGGCFVQSKLTYPKGTALELEFELEGLLVQAQATVRYSVPFVPHAASPQFPGMGIEFQGLSPEFSGQIRKLVTKEQLKQGLGVSAPGV